MKYIIRSVEDGNRISLDEIEDKKKSVKKKILEIGLQYVEYTAMLGSLDALGNRIEEQVVIIEDAGGTNYV